MWESRNPTWQAQNLSKGGKLFELQVSGKLGCTKSHGIISRTAVM